MRYTVNWAYHSSLCDLWGLGRLTAGMTLDLDEHQADAINGDSPGVLSVDAPKAAASKAEAPARKAAAASNRKAKPASDRAMTSESE